MLNENVGLKKSVAASLIKKVFGIYFIITIIVTGIQLTVEYFHVKDSIMQDIRKMEKTFKTSLVLALWTFDMTQLQSIIIGMNELSAVTGVKIDDTLAFDSDAKAIGTVLIGEEQVFVTSDGQRLTSSSDTFTPIKGVFSHSFQLDYDQNIGKNIGRVTIYSASGIVIDRIKYGFFLIVINSVGKTLVLWFIIFYYVRRIIGKPLTALTGTTKKVNPHNPDFFDIRYSPEEKMLLQSEDELGILARSFDEMRNAVLERIENLQRIRDLGEHLADSREISVTFRRIMEIFEDKFTFQKGAIFLPDDQNILRMTSCYPEAEDTDAEAESFRAGKGILTVKAAEKQEIIYMPDIHDHPDSAGEASVSESLLCVPLTCENDLSGVMNFSGTRGEFELTGENKVFLQAVARLAVINLKNIRMLNIVEENTRLKQEMELARHIQTSLLPDTTENIHPDFEIAAAMIPADEVGGDYYDITFDMEGLLWFGIGDVSGHGVTPGMIVMMAQTIHTAIVTNYRHNPAEAVSIINRVLYKNVHKRLRENHYMTFTALKYTGEGRFEHAGAHLPIIVYRDEQKRCEFVRTDGVFLNFIEDISEVTENSDFILNEGDILVLYTDGLTEAQNSKGEMLELDRLARTVETCAGESPVKLRDTVMETVMKWCDSKQEDDMTLIVARRRKT